MAITILALDAFCHVFLGRYLRRLRDAQSLANGPDPYWRWRAYGQAEDAAVELARLPLLGGLILQHLSRRESRYAQILERAL